MLDRDLTVATAEENEENSKLSLFGSLASDAWVFGGTLGLAFIGVAITYVNKDLSHLYWLTMIPVFGTLCYSAQWLRRGSTGLRWHKLLLREVLHWGGLLLAVELTYMLLSAGNIPRATTGMVTLLLLALVTFLYGVHLDRRFLGVGLFLGLSYVVMSYLAAYIWILLLIAALIATVAIFILKRVHARRSDRATGDVPIARPHAYRDAIKNSEV